jgi:hypothetical protein
MERYGDFMIGSIDFSDSKEIEKKRRNKGKRSQKKKFL